MSLIDANAIMYSNSIIYGRLLVDKAAVDRLPTIEAVPLADIYRIIAGHSDYHGDNILAALTCIAEGKTVNPVKSLEAEPVRHGRWIERSDKDIISMTHPYVCNLCGRVEMMKEPYCNCGAKMDLE